MTKPQSQSPWGGRLPTPLSSRVRPHRPLPFTPTGRPHGAASRGIRMAIIASGQKSLTPPRQREFDVEKASRPCGRTKEPNGPHEAAERKQNGSCHCPAGGTGPGRAAAKEAPSGPARPRRGHGPCRRRPAAREEEAHCALPPRSASEPPTAKPRQSRSVGREGPRNLERPLRCERNQKYSEELCHVV